MLYRHLCDQKSLNSYEDLFYVRSIFHCHWIDMFEEVYELMKSSHHKPNVTSWFSLAFLLLKFTFSIYKRFFLPSNQTANKRVQKNAFKFEQERLVNTPLTGAPADGKKCISELSNFALTWKDRILQFALILKQNYQIYPSKMLSYNSWCENMRNITPKKSF